MALTTLDKPAAEPRSHVPPGMPPLDLGGRATSFFEFWPMWLMYAPVAAQWLLLGARYRSLSLPLIANPAVPLSGMAGAAKTAVFDAAGAVARRWILPWMVHEVTAEPARRQGEAVGRALAARGLSFPLVGKPNIGCRGAGVRLLEDRPALTEYLSAFPPGAEIQFQRLSRWDAEAGVFYVRHPGSEAGEVTSLTLKYTPYVVGDGDSTLGELVAGDPRAGTLVHLYRDRHRDRWDQVVPAGEPRRLVFSASHCRGAVFRDGGRYVRAGLVRTLDRIFDDIPGFHYGRLDVKFRDIAGLGEGRGFEIIEINGASSESISIWDRDAGLGEAFGALLRQYRTLFKLGHANRRRGHRPPGLIELYRAWRREARLVRQYPRND